MARNFKRFAALALIAMIFAGFQYWAVTAKKREWYWLRGGNDYMMFADIFNKGDGKGHLLTVDKGSNGIDIEIKVVFSCKPAKISFPGGWKVKGDLTQVERFPMPSEWRVIHAPKPGMESEFMLLACQNMIKRPAFRLNTGSVPADLAAEAFSLVEAGVPPNKALAQASDDK